jgi:hypothetical protein
VRAAADGTRHLRLPVHRRWRLVADARW